MLPDNYSVPSFILPSPLHIIIVFSYILKTPTSFSLILSLNLNLYFYISIKSKAKKETSPVVQWLRLQASTPGGTGSILGEGTKISHAAQCCQK